MQWLEEVFLKYLTDWERCVDEREGFNKTVLLYVNTLVRSHNKQIVNYMFMV